jgi:hypothetical protein
MNWEQVKGIVERILGFAVMYGAGAGWFPETVGSDIVAGAMLLIGAIWAWKVNTPASLASAAEATKS